MHKRICLGNFRRPCVTALHHNSHGIMLQDFSCPADQEVEGDMPSIPIVHESGIRSLKLETQDALPDCYLTHRRSPIYEVEKTEISAFSSRSS
jgi:hypothetical protein